MSVCIQNNLIASCSLDTTIKLLKYDDSNDWRLIGTHDDAVKGLCM